MIRLHLKATATRSGASSRPATVALGAAVTVTALLLVTAIASVRPLSGAGQAVAAPGGGRSQINAPPWALVLVAVGALVALLGILATVDWPLLRRRKDKPPPRRVVLIPKAARIVALLVAALLGAVLVVAAIEGSHVRQALPRVEAPLPPPRAAPAYRASSSYKPPTWILPTAVGIVLGGGGAVLLVTALRRRSARRVEPSRPLAAAALLEETVEASLEDLRRDPDPRHAVIAAYRRMETTLGDVGLPRRAWEAPREYSGRAHTYLELSTGPLGTLTALFERARFSVGRVDEPLREQAIAALVALRAELRA